MRKDYFVYKFLPTTAVCLAVLSFFGQLIEASSSQHRKRARDLGIKIGFYNPGQWNAITDVNGVKVGHVTLYKGEGKLVIGQGPIRTGVTAIIPHSKDLALYKVFAGKYVLNGRGEMTGVVWLEESGALDTPILLTNTLSVGRVCDALISYMLKNYPKTGHEPVVAECWDGFLNDIWGRHVSESDVLKALSEAKSGSLEEGAVGAGTGMTCYGFKGGIGTSSRRLPSDLGGYIVGVLVNANHGRREQLVINGVQVGRELSEWNPIDRPKSSIIIVVATDAPLTSGQLNRLAKRASLGLARTGSASHHSSGDIIIAFSTGNLIPHFSKGATLQIKMMDDSKMSPLFQATVEATEEAIINALIAAQTVTGRDGNTSYALPHDKVIEIMRKYHRIQ